MKNYLLSSLLLVTVLAVATQVRASDCPYTNYAIIDGKCVNLDPQMVPKKPQPSTNSSQSRSEIDELTGSSLMTYGSLMFLLLGTVGGWKFLNR